MKFKTKVVLFTIALIAPLTITTHAHAHASGAGYQYSVSATNKVITNENVKLYRVKVGDNESDNQFKFVKTLSAGTYLKVSDWIMSTGGGYVVTNNKYKPDANHFYFIFEKKSNVWFEPYTPKRMAQIKKELSKIDKKYAKEESDENKSFKKAEDQDVQDNKNFAKENPLGVSQFQYTNDTNALNAVGYNYIKSVNCIYENVSPMDSKALLPQGFQVKNGVSWENTVDQKIYDYLDAAHAKKQYYTNAGWQLQ